MNFSLTYFLERGIRFEYEPGSAGVPTVYGPLTNPLLQAQLRLAVEARRGLPRRAKPHDGECDQEGHEGESTFCRQCRFVKDTCVFCGSTGLGRGNLDCPLCRLAAMRVIREREAAAIAAAKGEPF
jgi:hypothetical protein